MSLLVLLGICIPLIGTSVGAGAVFVMPRGRRVGEGILQGFAAGVMVAASVFSLLLPALEGSQGLGAWSSVLVTGSMLLGMGLLFLFSQKEESDRLSLAVTLHNIPEGMAVGVIFASYLVVGSHVAFASAMAFSLGIGIQNIPEGAIISLPAYARGRGRLRAFLDGVLSGVVEPLAAILAILLSRLATSLLPCLLAGAAGAMLYVVVEELIPRAQEAPHKLGVLSFGVGFALMMLLDVLLG